MRVCVYCSSSSAVDKEFSRAALELGRTLGERGHTLVYGGCDIGLMGHVARAAHAAGGRVIGVVPRRIKDLGIVYEAADERHDTETMGERKALMERLSDAFVALPGGFGTLEETLQVLTLKQLGELDAAVVLVNVLGFYEPLLAFFEELYSQRFAREGFRALYHVVESVEDALDHVEHYVPANLPDKVWGTEEP